MPSFLDSAYQILKDMDRPMSVEEITQQALDRGFLVTKGKTPAATMSAMIYMDIKRKGQTSRFIQVGPNCFTVNNGSKEYPESAFKPKSKPKATKQKSSLLHADSDHKLLDHEIALIRSFLDGISSQPPTSEKLCDWITMCYTLGLYSEGMDLFDFVDPLDVNEWYYTRTKKLARLCALHHERSNTQKASQDA